MKPIGFARVCSAAWWRAAVVILSFGGASAGWAADPMVLRPFTTDGCSMFPNRAPVGSADWCHCCAAHDIAYWRGGTSRERLQADEELKACVLKASGDRVLAEMMFAGVRSGGQPQVDTPFRWAYGWPRGRNYTPLSEADLATALRLERLYREANPTLQCAR